MTFECINANMNGPFSILRIVLVESTIEVIEVALLWCTWGCNLVMWSFDHHGRNERYLAAPDDHILPPPAAYLSKPGTQLHVLNQLIL